MARTRRRANEESKQSPEASAVLSTATEKGPVDLDMVESNKGQLTQTPPATVEKPVNSTNTTKRRKPRSPLRRFKDTCLKHTWLLPFLILAVLLAVYAVNPTESNPLHHAIFLSYPQEPKIPGGPVMYGKGKKDFAFVAFYTVFLSFTREFLMQCVIRPMAKLCGIKNRSKTGRFMEQVYTAIYFGVFGPFGLYVMKQTNIWYFNTTAMFEGFPHKEHVAIFKAYYLLQASYWAQQAIVLMLQLEKPRKDFRELVLHHIVTLSLIFLSYRFHFTYMGIAVYITHDVSDFFLALSKTLNYLDSVIIVPFFSFFITVWIYMRHYINLKILWATLTEFRTVGPFDLNWETQQYKCWISQVITFGLLASLQAVNLFWLFLILRILGNYIFNNVKKDERSDDEDEDDVPSENQLNEHTVTATAIDEEPATARQSTTTGKENEAPQVNSNGKTANGSVSGTGGKSRNSGKKNKGS